MNAFSILIQLIGFVFGYATGRHDVPAVDNFTTWGSTDKQQHDFHRFNWILKACYVVGAFAPLCFYPFTWLLLIKTCLLAACTMCIVWGVFDPVVNVYRTPKKDIFYLSDSNKTDRFLLKHLGKDAGRKKTAICVLALIILNVINFIL